MPTLLKKPSLEEALQRARETGLPETEVQAFMDHYESNGWKVGRNPMVCWKAALRNWKRNFDSGIYRNKLQPTKINGAQLIIHQKEYERCLALMNAIRNSYGSMQSWTEGDKKKFAELKARKLELEKLLGIKL